MAMSYVSKNEVENIIKLWGAHRYASANDIACLTNPYRSPPTCKRIYPWPKYNGLKLKQSQIVNACLAHPDKTVAWIASEMGHGDQTVFNAISKAIVLGHMDQDDILIRDGATVAKPKSRSIAEIRRDEIVQSVVDVTASEIEEMMYPGTCTVGTEGRHDDKGKARYDLIAPELLDQVAQVLDYGAGKYEDRDWEKGSRWGRHFASAMRHMWDWWRGEDYDGETGISHLAHAACRLMFLMAYQDRGKGTDDRGE